MFYKIWMIGNIWLFYEIRGKIFFSLWEKCLNVYKNQFLPYLPIIFLQLRITKKQKEIYIYLETECICMLMLNRTTNKSKASGIFKILAQNSSVSDKHKMEVKKKKQMKHKFDKKHKKGCKQKQFEQKKVSKIDALKANINQLTQNYQNIDSKKLQRFR